MTRCCLGVLAWVAVGVASGAAAYGADKPEPPQIQPRQPAEWATGLYVPAYVQLQGRGIPATVTLEVGSSLSGERGQWSCVTRRQAHIAASGYARVEMPYLGASNYFAVDGLPGLPRQPSGFHQSGYPAWIRETPIYTVNAFHLKTLTDRQQAEREALGEAEMTRTGLRGVRFFSHHDLALDMLPERWTSYAGLTGIILFEARDVERLTPAQKVALTRWVRWGGGCLWLAGPDAWRAARSIGLPARETAEDLAEYAHGWGKVWIQPDPEGREPFRVFPVAAGGGPLHAFAAPATPRSYLSLFEGFVGVPTAWIVVMTLAFGLVLGPFNFWLAWRWRRPMLVFVFAPVLALAGSFVLMIGSVVVEGTAVRYSEAVLLAVDADADEALMTDVRVVYSGYGAPAPEYPVDTALAPFRESMKDPVVFVTEQSADVTRLAGGWITPRRASGILAMRPVKARMDVTVVADGGGYSVINNLTHTLRRVVVQLAPGAYASADRVAPGERKPLLGDETTYVIASDNTVHALAPGRKPSAKDVVVSDVPLSRWKQIGGNLSERFAQIDFSKAVLMAECEGLPYREDGGLGGERLRGEYYYVRLDNNRYTAVAEPEALP